MKLATKFSLITVIIVIVLSFLLELFSLMVFNRATHDLHKRLFMGEVQRFAFLAYEQDELYFEGVYADESESRMRVEDKIRIEYRNNKDPATFPFIIETSGKTVLVPENSPWGEDLKTKNNRIFDENALAFMRQHKEGELEYFSLGERRWCVFKTYEPWNWIFCMTTTVQNKNQAAISFLRWALIIPFIVIILSILAALVISRKFVEPIHAVIQKILDIAGGKVGLGQKIIVKNMDGDEVGMLVSAVNKMSTDLSKVTVSRNDLSEEVARRKKIEVEREIRLNRQQDITILQQQLLVPDPLENKLKIITDNIVRIFDADFCRIWLIRKGDLCQKGCVHAQDTQGPHVCIYRDKCLHLLASSGRYVHIDGKGHARVPFGCYKIGLIASNKEHKFLTNNVVNDPQVHNHEWARELGLVSFVGYQLKVSGGETMGVLALFAKHPISSDEDAMLDSLSTTASFVIQQDILREELISAYAGLEDKVKERTRELREAQDRIVRSEKMAIVGQLASSVAHELRNPLGVMKNAIYYLNMLKVGDNNDDIKENLEIISSEIANSDKVISDLLEFSRIKQPILKPEDINLIIKETLNRIRVPVDVKIVMELGENLSLVQVDALQMQQVFYNLATNAVQAMAKGGVLIVSSSVMPDGAIAVAFKDNGGGIPKENLHKIFEPLFSTKIKGTGLGLSVVTSLVEGHGGKLEVESQVGKGSIFTVKLPMR
ncbi:MAG: ATP-binding protein [Candidatus Omnitrophica bacterium]|nr:ATP-binding protein [Candidatus Omnitrophota bacterium]